MDGVMDAVMDAVDAGTPTPYVCPADSSESHKDPIAADP
jgi:hypothetical protein